MVKSSLSNSPVPRSEFKVTGQIPSQKRKVQVPVHPPHSKQKHWLIKNHEVVKVNFENLWIITKLFASDDWKLIRKWLEVLFQTKIVIFEVIGDHFGGLLDIASKTLSLINVSEPWIQVKNFCGFVPFTIEITDLKKGNIYIILEILNS